MDLQLTCLQKALACKLHLHLPDLRSNFAVFLRLVLYLFFFFNLIDINLIFFMEHRAPASCHLVASYDGFPCINS